MECIIMHFAELLKKLYKELNCTQTTLAQVSGLSPSVISRYLSGDRIPAADSEQLQALSRGLSEIAISQGITDSVFSYESLIGTLQSAIQQKENAYGQFASHFDQLIACLNIHIKSMAAALNFDTSYLYRVRTGERHPSDLENFCDRVADYIADNYASVTDLPAVAELFHCPESELTQPTDFRQHIITYLLSDDGDNNENLMSGFLSKMDEFNLDEYIKVIHFDELKVPSMPVHLPTSKYYYGIANMRNAELDFFKTTVLGKSKEDIFMFGDMPMADMAEDMDFNKKWMSSTT